MQTNNYNIKTMTRQDLNLAVEWAAKEGWNPGLHDADSYYRADPQGFLVGMLGDEAIAAISAVRYGKGFGFLGFYLVKPEYRGRGYGIQIWDAGLKYLQGRNIGLDGVVAQQSNYQKSGFTLAYRNIRYEGKGGGPSPDAEIVQLSRLPVESITTYDRPFFPDERADFIKAWIAQADCHALGIMAHDKLAGYGVIRPCRTGYKIGPLFADTPVLAEGLFQALKSKLKDRDSIYLDVPEPNQAAVTLSERHGMTVSFETARMYTGAFPHLPMNRLFGVTSFEIG